MNVNKLMRTFVRVQNMNKLLPFFQSSSRLFSRRPLAPSSWRSEFGETQAVNNLLIQFGNSYQFINFMASRIYHFVIELCSTWQKKCKLIAQINNQFIIYNVPVRRGAESGGSRLGKKWFILRVTERCVPLDAAYFILAPFPNMKNRNS